METSFSRANDCLVVLPPKRLDTITSPEAADAVSEKIEHGDHKIIFDLSQTEYVSSAGFRVILVALKLLKKVEGKMVLCGANTQILDVIEMSGFHLMVQHRDTLDEAIDVVCS
jgi:anti-anti-sigma factor